MSKKKATTTHAISAQPRIHQRAAEIQAYGTVSHMLPLDLEEPVRLEMTERLNVLLADTITLRDLYKKSHWQVAGPTFYQLHLLFDKHFEEQVEIVDEIAERIQLLGGVSLATGPTVTSRTPSPFDSRKVIARPAVPSRGVWRSVRASSGFPSIARTQSPSRTPKPGCAKGPWASGDQAPGAGRIKSMPRDRGTAA